MAGTDIEVEGPDGQVFAFPSGTADTVMRTALLKHYQTGPGKGWESRVLAAPDPMETPVDPSLANVGDLLTRDGQVRNTVRQELDAEKAAGLPQDGVGRRFLQGASFNTADELLAAGMTIPNMIKHRTLDPREGYAYAKAKEDMRLEDARKESPILGGLGEALGGTVSGGALSKIGATAIPAATSWLGGVAGTAVGGAVDGAALGALSGFMDGEDGHRLEEAKNGALVGAGFGAGVPLALAAAKPVVAPIASNIAARVNPQGYAERQVGRALERSGQTADQVGNRIAQAAVEGQGEYRLLDALDYPGARLGAVVAKNPGEGRTQLREFLNDRQQGQSYRLSNALAEGLDAPETAQAASNRMTAARRQMDDEAFGAVRADANPVDVTPAVETIDATLRPGVTGELGLQNGIAYDSVEGALARARALLTDGRSQSVDFEVVQRARGDIADAVEKARRAGEGNKARLLRGVRDALDQQMEAASPGFRDAMGRSRAAANEVDAIETGRNAAQRGRSEDKIGAFEAMTPGEQAAFRAGYADPLIAKVQAAPEGANKARPFTSQAMQTELPAFAAEGRGDQLMRQIQRENEMFTNRNEALGSSKTAENLADNADTGLDAGLVMKLLGGSFVGATRDALMRGAAALNGNTEAVRREMARLLMEGDRNRAVTMLVRLGQQNTRRSDIGQGVFRGLLAGGAPALTSATASREPANRR
ncbi:hypothetical protein [Methylobacterium komagatae]